MDDSPVQSQTLERACELPGAVISFACGTAQEAMRGPGLILTREQLIDLKRYETHGLALPTVLRDVVWYLGYERGAGLNLEARDFQETFNLVHDHALRWNPIRTSLMNVGSELWVFADQMQVYETAVQALYDHIKSKPEIAPADADDFLHYLQQVAVLVMQHRGSTEALKSTLDDFALHLSSVVMPAVQLKLRSIANIDTSPQTRRLNGTINSRADHVMQQQREYRTQVENATDATSPQIGLNIYKSAEAHRTRQQLKQLRVAQLQEIFQLAQQNTIHASLQRLRNDLQDVTLVILDAGIAINNMVTVWNGLHTYLTASIQEANKIDSSLTLRRLMNAFRLVAEPWRQIKRDADTLLKVFKEADRDFRRDHGYPWT